MWIICKCIKIKLNFEIIFFLILEESVNINSNLKNAITRKSIYITS